MKNQKKYENLDNKDELVNYYLDNYEDQYKIPFCELILTKIGINNLNSTIKLTENQRTIVTNILSDITKNDNKKFKDCLNCLTFNQISCIGW
jgi:hypothetical protein